VTLALALQILALVNGIGGAALNADKIAKVIEAHKAQHGPAANTTPLVPEHVQAIQDALASVNGG
jgi:hypothetical protein